MKASCACFAPRIEALKNRPNFIGNAVCFLLNELPDGRLLCTAAYRTVSKSWPPSDLIEIEIHYCPFCGRLLK